MRFGRYIYIHAPSSSLLLVPMYLRADGGIFSGLGAVLMDGGVETSVCYLQTFIIALLQNPEIQLKAQKEVDSVVGGDRLPVLEDFKRLPYVKALVMEVSLIFSVDNCSASTSTMMRSSDSDPSFLLASHMSRLKT